MEKNGSGYDEAVNEWESRKTDVALAYSAEIEKYGLLKASKRVIENCKGFKYRAEDAINEPIMNKKEEEKIVEARKLVYHMKIHDAKSTRKTADQAASDIEDILKIRETDDVQWENIMTELGLYRSRNVNLGYINNPGRTNKRTRGNNRKRGDKNRGQGPKNQGTREPIRSYNTSTYNNHGMQAFQGKGNGPPTDKNDDMKNKALNHRNVEARNLAPGENVVGGSKQTREPDYEVVWTDKDKYAVENHSRKGNHEYAQSEEENGNWVQGINMIFFVYCFWLP